LHGVLSARPGERRGHHAQSGRAADHPQHGTSVPILSLPTVHYHIIA